MKEFLYFEAVVREVHVVLAALQEDVVTSDVMDPV